MTALEVLAKVAPQKIDGRADIDDFVHQMLMSEELIVRINALEFLAKAPSGMIEARVDDIFQMLKDKYRSVREAALKLLTKEPQLIEARLVENAPMLNDG